MVNTNSSKYYQRKLDWIIRNPMKVAYNSQKQTAKKRNIEWNFSYKEWSKLWNESGLWDKRGKKAGCVCMCRYGDTGPYSVDNTYIGDFVKNSIQGRWKDLTDEEILEEIFNGETPS